MGDKVAFVTGASRGIGKGIALELAEAGYDVALTARTTFDGESREHSSTLKVGYELRSPGRSASTAELGAGRRPALPHGAGRPARPSVARLGRRRRPGGVGAHRRPREQRALRRARAHGLHPRHASTRAARPPRSQRARTGCAHQGDRAADDRARWRHRDQHHVGRRATAIRRRPPGRAAGVSATRSARVRFTASPGSSRWRTGVPASAPSTCSRDSSSPSA